MRNTGPALRYALMMLAPAAALFPRKPSTLRLRETFSLRVSVNLITLV